MTTREQSTSACRQAFEAEFFTGMSHPSEWSKETTDAMETLYRIYEHGWLTSRRLALEEAAGKCMDMAGYLHKSAYANAIRALKERGNEFSLPSNDLRARGA